MKTVRYVCTHCGKKFEAEEKEVLECPGCFWSTSVKREDEASEPSNRPVEKNVIKPYFKIPVLPSSPWKLIAKAAGIILILFFAVQIIPPVLKSVKQNPKPKKESAPKTPVNVPSPAAGTAVEGLPAEDQAVLTRRVQISADRNPSEEEKKVLDARASFKTGFSEKLPSQAWTIENFKEMIKQQEQFFKVPLPRSYKGKLEDLFTASYLPAAEAFKNGDLIAARNGWIESLAFPIYGNNPQKHRGVALTMLKPFITDTLSKIGTINSVLVEKSQRDHEQEAAAEYQEFVTLIDQKKWPEALKDAEDLITKINSFSAPQQTVLLPEYPPAIGKVDTDIQASIQELSKVPPPAVSDLEPMLQDLLVKKRIIESFIPEKLSLRQMAYDSALESIGHKDWAEAKKKLREIDTPLEMVKDAAEKIKIISKLENPAQPKPADSAKT